MHHVQSTGIEKRLCLEVRKLGKSLSRVMRKPQLMCFSFNALVWLNTVCSFGWWVYGFLFDREGESFFKMTLNSEWLRRKCFFRHSSIFFKTASKQHRSVFPRCLAPCCLSSLALDFLPTSTVISINLCWLQVDQVVWDGGICGILELRFACMWPSTSSQGIIP